MDSAISAASNVVSRDFYAVAIWIGDVNRLRDPMVCWSEFYAKIAEAVLSRLEIFPVRAKRDVM